MSIDIEPRNLGAIVQLVAKSDGWKPEETRYRLTPIYIGGDPNSPIADHTPENLKELLRAAWLTTKEKRPTDFNGLKVAVSRLAVRDGVLITDGYITDYFTLWGIPRAAEEQFQKHSEEIVVNKAKAPEALYETSLPWGISTHNVLLDENGDVLMLIRAQDQGFHAGRVSLTEEEQMDPDRDFDPFNAAYTSYWEELGIFVPTSTVRLLGVAVEIGAAYPAYCFIANTNLVAASIVEKWRGAQDYRENTSIFAVPMSKIDEWLKDQITSETWHEYHLAGNIDKNAVLSLHPTVPWRVALTKQYTKAS